MKKEDSPNRNAQDNGAEYQPAPPASAPQPVEQGAPESPESPEQASPKSSPPAAGTEALAAEIERLAAAVEEKEREAKANYDRFLRERAELENFKRRSLRERAESLKYANENLLRDLLPVIDNLERAIEHVERGGNGQSVAEGLALILKSLLDALERHGVKQLRTKGELFDPALHEAISKVECEREEPNRIVEEYRKGYTFHDRLLRPAAVAVAKVPEDTKKKEDSDEEQVEKPERDG